MTSKFSTGLLHEFRKNFIHKILLRGPDRFTDVEPQEYISKINNDMPAVVEDYYCNIIDVIFQVVSIVVSCSVLTGIYFPLALTSILTSILIAWIPFLFKKNLQAKREKALESLGKYNISLKDAVTGYWQIRYHQIMNAMTNIVRLSSLKNTDETYKFEKANAWSEITIGFVSFMGSFLVIALGVWQVSTGKMNVGSLFAAIQLSDLLIQPILGISVSLTAVVSSRKIKDNLQTFFAEEPNKEKLALSEPIESISFRNVSLSYGGKTILHNFNYVFEKNKKYLITGSNGSGKSSIIKLIADDIPHLKNDISGSVTVNHLDRKQLDDRDFFNKIEFIPQFSYLFTGSLWDNLTLFGEVKTDELESILSELREENILELLKDNRAVTNEGMQVSGGEKEKLALLRAFLRKKKWLILDESTAAMDKKSKAVYENYILSQKNLTVIHIAHNYSEEDIQKYDAVIKMDQDD